MRKILSESTSDNPTADVPGVEQIKLAPKWLKRPEQAALLRKVKARARVRDIALVTCYWVQYQQLADKSS